MPLVNTKITFSQSKSIKSLELFTQKTLFENNMSAAKDSAAVNKDWKDWAAAFFNI